MSLPQLCFCRTGRSLRCWRPHLGDRTQFMLLFVLKIFSIFLKGYVPLVLSSLQGPWLILHSLSVFFMGFWGFLCFLLRIRILRTRSFGECSTSGDGCFRYCMGVLNRMLFPPYNTPLLACLCLVGCAVDIPPLFLDS